MRREHPERIRTPSLGKVSGSKSCDGWQTSWTVESEIVLRCRVPWLRNRPDTLEADFRECRIECSRTCPPLVHGAAHLPCWRSGGQGVDESGLESADARCSSWPCHHLGGRARRREVRVFDDRIPLLSNRLGPALPLRQGDGRAMSVHLGRCNRVAALGGHQCPVRAHLVVAPAEPFERFPRLAGAGVVAINRIGARFRPVGFPTPLSRVIVPSAPR